MESIKEVSTTHITVDIRDVNEELCNTEKTIEKIYHLADIHIEYNTSRYEEYKTVFKRLYNKLKEDPTNALCVICGDIVHDKSKLSSSQVQLLTDLFINISNIMPIVVIIGNHDINPNGNFIDSISPLIKYLDTKHKIHLLLRRGSYEYNNIIFGLTEMTAKTITKVINNPQNKRTIGLYHGMVGIFKLNENDNNTILGSQSTFDVTDFTDIYDMTLLGDIHKFQYLNKNKNIAYSGSLLQRTFNEDLNHGLIKWNVLTKESEFIKIPNDNGFIKLEVNENGLEEFDYTQMPKNPIIRLQYDNISLEKVEDIGKELQTKYNARYTTIHNLRNIKIKKKNGEEPDNTVLEVKSNNNIKVLILDFLKNNHKYNDDTIDKVDKKITNILQELNYNYEYTDKKFELISLKFDNYFIFGKNNEIDFTKMNGIVGIEGEYASGKSAIIESILTALYGTCQRGNSSEAIRFNEKKMTMEIIFKINNEQYKIHRIRNRTPKSSTEKIKLYKNNKDITDDTVQLTNKKINSIICEQDVLTTTYFMLQQKCTNYAELTEKDRYSLICKYLNLDIFAFINKNIISQIINIQRDQKSILRKLTTDNHNLEIMKYGELFNSKKVEYSVLKINSSELLQNKNMYNDKMVQYYIKLQELKELKKNITNIDEIILKKNKINLEIDKTNNELIILNNNNIYIISEIEKNNTELIKYNNIEKQYLEFKVEKEKKIDLLNKEYDKLLKSRKNECNKNSNICEYTNINKENKLKLQEIKLNISNNEKLITNTVIHEIIKTTDIENSYNKYNLLSNQLINHKKKLEDINKKIKKCLKLEKGFNNHDYNDNCEACMKNPITVDKIKNDNEITKNKLLQEKKSKQIDTKENRREKVKDKYNEFINIMKLEDDNTQNKIFLDKITQENIILEKDSTILFQEIDKLDILIVEDKINKQNKIFNKNILQKGISIKKELEEIKKSDMSEYLEYNNKKEVLKSNEDTLRTNIENINKINNKLNTIKLELNLHKHEISKNHDIINKINDYEEIEKLNNDTVHNYKTISKEYELIKEKIEILNKEVHEYEFKIKNLKEQQLDFDNKTQSKAICEIIGDLLNNDGLVDSIMKNDIIPTMEKRMNEIFRYIAKYSVILNYNNRGLYIKKKTHDGKVVSINSLSGAESFIANMCFRLTLIQYQQSFKTNFIIMDESFSYCDADFINKLPELFDYLKNYFKFVLLISHNENVIKLYENRIHINIDDKNGNQITY
jgi:DNA repair exonuclease SbcCD ATPase subunit